MIVGPVIIKILKENMDARRCEDTEWIRFELRLRRSWQPLNIRLVIGIEKLVDRGLDHADVPEAVAKELPREQSRLACKNLQGEGVAADNVNADLCRPTRTLREGKLDILRRSSVYARTWDYATSAERRRRVR